MPTQGFPTGAIQVYGVVIGDLIHSASSSVEELVDLRSQVFATVQSQGDLVKALQALDAEIARRGDATATREAATVPAGQSFLVNMPGWILPPDVMSRIEERIKSVVLEELAKTDHRGDLKATPLSQIETWGAQRIFGSQTAGLVITPPIVL